jgi:purine nucleoside permease
MFALNAGLADWAYGLTKASRCPTAPIWPRPARPTPAWRWRSPPKVMTGDNLAAMTFWHGAMMTQWAHDWVDFWTGGKGTFVTSAMEETGTFQSIDYLSRVGRADRNRVMVLRGASNSRCRRPACLRRNLLKENESYSGMNASLEALYTVGSKVVDTLLADWPRYEKMPPKAPAQ